MILWRYYHIIQKQSEKENEYADKTTDKSYSYLSNTRFTVNITIRNKNFTVRLLIFFFAKIDFYPPIFLEFESTLKTLFTERTRI
jgi:hypothetical protein